MGQRGFRHNFARKRGSSRKSSTPLQTEEESGYDLQEDEVIRGKHQAARLPVSPRPFRLGERIQVDWAPEGAHLRVDEAGDGREDHTRAGVRNGKRMDRILGKLSSKPETVIANSPKVSLSLALLLEVRGVLGNFCCYVSPAAKRYGIRGELKPLRERQSRNIRPSTMRR